MDELVMRLGNGEGLLLELDWESRHVSVAATGADATRGRLRLAVRGQVVWQAEDPDQGFLWTWIELLEHLANAWPYLIWEDNLPLGLRAAVPGANLRSVWIVREGELCSICVEGRVVVRPLGEVLETLEQVGEEVSGRLQGAAHDERSAHARKAWAERAELSNGDRMSLISEGPSYRQREPADRRAAGDGQSEACDAH